MSETRVEMKLNDERNALTMIFPTTPPAKIVGSTEEVASIISKWGLMRTMMLPSVPENFPHDEAVRAHRDPTWHADNDRLAGDAMLSLRHPGFGWLHFIFSREQSAAIGRRLVELSQLPPPPAEGRA